MATRKEPQECRCGCGGMTKGGRFLPGHDARIRGLHSKTRNIEHAGLQAWHNGTVDSDEIAGITGTWHYWNIATVDPTETAARVRVHTERKKVTNWEDMNRAKYQTKTSIMVEVVVGYSATVTLDSPCIWYTGMRGAMRKLMETLAHKQNGLISSARLSVEQELREMGIPEWRIMDCFDSRRDVHLKMLCWMRNRVAEEKKVQG